MEYYSSLDASKLDQGAPSLFEVISASQLEALLSPSLRYILVHYAQRYPAYLLRITNRFDELNLLLRTAVEWYFFKHWQGGFTENFYGIKRVSSTLLSNTKYDSAKLSQLTPSMMEKRRSLSSLQSIISIFEITGLSYLSEKLNHHYELLYSKFITNQLNVSDAATATEARKVRFQVLFVRFFPYIQSAYRLSNLIATLSYLSGATKSPSLLTFLFKVDYARLSQYDYSKNEPTKPRQRHTRLNRVSPPSSLEHILQFLQRYVVKPSLKSSKIALGTFFPLAIFSLKFLEWWNDSTFARTVAKSQRNDLEDPIPPPSVLKVLFSTNQKLSKTFQTKSSCPLCEDEISNPAIIETGHVFCYTCIYNHLRDSHKHVGRKVPLMNIQYNEEEFDDKRENQLSEKTQHIQRGGNDAEMVFIDKGGRCPVTGQKLLGCKWNEVTGEFDVNGIRRLIF